MFGFTKKTTVFLLVLGAAVLALVGCTAAAGSVADTPAVGGSEITVVGQGTAYGEPDQAQVNLGVETFAETVTEATSQNEATVQQIMAALADLGIPAEDIQTSNYSLWAEQIYGERGPEGIAGYRVTNTVTVTLRDIDQVGSVLGAVTEAGANSIYGISFSVADPAALQAEARAAAMDDARARAASLAELSGLTLGEVKIVSEVIGQPVPLGMGGGGFAVAEAAADPSISPGQLSYQVQVQVTYQAN